MDLHFLHKNLETNLKVALHREKEFLKLWHYHPEYELVYISRGRGTIYAGDYIGPYQPGNVFLIGAHLPHMFESSPASLNPDDEEISKPMLCISEIPLSGASPKTMSNSDISHLWSNMPSQDYSSPIPVKKPLKYSEKP